MSSRTLQLDEQLHAYMMAQAIPESPVARALRHDTLNSGMPHVMQISPEQGAFMALLVRMLGATRAIEVGTFTGYSALVVAEALPDHGKLITCDLSDEWTRFGRKYWERGGVADRIDLRLGPATETLERLIDEGHADTFDFGFIDADKSNYTTYFEQLVTLLRSGGAIAIDNVLWGGAVADADNQSESTRAIRAVTHRVSNDTRVWSTMLPIGDGLTIALKK